MAHWLLQTIPELISGLAVKLPIGLTVNSNVHPIDLSVDRAPKSAKRLTLSLFVAAMLLTGCQAKEVFNDRIMNSSLVKNFNDRAKMSDYSFTAADQFGVIVSFADDKPKTMHQPVIAPLTEQLAVMLNEELGVTGVTVDESVYNRWRDDQISNQVTVEGEDPAEIDEALFFRQRGYRGYLWVTASELLDGAARNDFDYSLRTKFALRILETSEKGDIAPALAKFTTVRAVCSRRYRSKDTSNQAARLRDGYELSNIQRCAATPVYRARLRLAEEK